MNCETCPRENDAREGLYGIKKDGKILKGELLRIASHELDLNAPENQIVNGVLYFYYRSYLGTDLKKL